MRISELRSGVKGAAIPGRLHNPQSAIRNPQSSEVPMSSPAVLDVDALVKPVPGPNPAGAPLPYSVERELNELRKEADELDKQSPDPSVANRRADWGKIIRLASSTLTSTSKDLLAATRLAEAVTNTKGIPGLRDGLRLLHRLVADCWDRVQPVLADGEGMEVRAGPFIAFNSMNREGVGVPQSVRKAPLVTAGGEKFSYLDWLAADRKREFEGAIPKADPKALVQTYQDLTEARQALHDLAKALDEKLGADLTPDFLSSESPGNLGNAIDQCVGLVKAVAKEKKVRLGDEPEEGGEPPDPHGGDGQTGDKSVPPRVSGTREGLYRQLGEIARALRAIEPHSPIPFLLERCVKLGGQPFPELMRSIIHETGTLDALDRLLGIEHPKPSGE
jgi:type VI secretion system protein ImpA